MDTSKNLGIWMDHSEAQLINLNSTETIHIINSKFDSDVQEETIHKSENLKHNKRQQLHRAFYNEIADEVFKYDKVLLFGPTNAKTELYNFLQLDLYYKDKKIDIMPADKMTDNEKVAFVKKHFIK